MSDSNPVTAIDDLDLDRYLGLWYEIARLPLRYEDAEASNVTAQYSLDDGSIRVDNRCLDADGEPTQAVGRATPAGDSPAQLEVTFLPEGLRWIPFTKGDYWVLKLDADYQHALVGTPDHKNLWLLARTPHVDAAVEQEFLTEAARQGFDLTDLIRPVQDGGRVTDEALASSAES
ncbi:lipocalin family protein [Pseudactinotalea terrae]|uniref:lipocalin family protein n=1 Tax=Pseudactinotalea terrae TaxID=1743262 RepID=UPI0012E201B1|nr:lipocalin family protein [Pseudactinotalea terrae]